MIRRTRASFSYLTLTGNPRKIKAWHAYLGYWSACGRWEASSVTRDTEVQRELALINTGRLARLGRFAWLLAVPLYIRGLWVKRDSPEEGHESNARLANVPDMSGYSQLNGDQPATPSGPDGPTKKNA